MDQKGKDKKQKQDKYLQEIIAKGWENQNKQLNDKGFTDPKENLKILIKCNGDLAVGLAKLEDSKKPKGKHLLDDEYCKQATQLAAQGFPDVKENLKALHKSNGDVEKAKVYLKDKQSDPKKQEKAKKKAEWTKLAQQLIQEGFPSEEANLKALKKNDGDIVKARAYLQQSDKKHKDQLKLASQYYLDGNNILFCLEDLRSQYLKNEKEQAQQVLRERISKALKGAKQVHIVFSESSSAGDFDVEGGKIIVVSAKGNSGDHLVELAKTAPEGSIFVTNDKNLKERLKKVKVMKSIDFIKYLH